MSKPECTQQKSCDYCEKRGVPILPLRYAVAMPNAGAPKPASPPSIALPAVSGQYTLRLLRSGYLYVYDEARKRWDDYFVTADGYFCKIFPVKGQPTPVPSKAFNCCDPSHRALASCITIPDAKRATKVWLGFSDAQWTDDVRKRHESADYRKQHMRCVDVNAYTAGADGKHCLPIKNVGAKVAEYTLDDTALKKALSFSQHAATGRKSGTALLIAESERLMPQKGFAIALEDPVGIAADLSALMGYQLYNYTNDKSRKRPFMVSSAILQIEAAVKEHALEAENAAAEELADKMLSTPDIGMLFPSYRDKKIKKSEDIRTVTEAQIQLAEKNAWQKYRDKFDEPAMKSWRNKFDEKFKEFDKSHIAPLAENHISWMKSKSMSHYFECNFDSQNADSGIVYAKATLLCIHGTQDKAACFNLYADWLEKDSISKENILLRALTLNLEKTSSDINNALKVNIDWRGLPLDPIVGAFGKSLERLTGGTADTIGRLITALYGPLGKLFNQALDGKVRPAMVALSLYTEKTFTVVEITGGKKAFRSMLIRELTKANGKALNPREMERAVSAQLRRLKAAGVPLENTEKKRFLLLVDTEQASGLPKGLKAPEQAKWLANSIRTPEELEKINFSNWRSKVGNPAVAIAKGSVPYISGLVTALLQYNAMQKLIEDEGKAMSHEAVEAHGRLRAGIMALAGTVADTIGQGLTKLVPRLVNFGKGIAITGLVTGWLGKAAGVAGALLMAYWDYQQAKANFAKGNSGLGWAYIGSSLLGAAVALAVLVGWTGIGLILVGLLISLTIFIEFFKPNKVQEWLERSLWGKGPNSPYQNETEEFNQLKIATS